MALLLLVVGGVAAQHPEPHDLPSVPFEVTGPDVVAEPEARSSLFAEPALSEAPSVEMINGNFQIFNNTTDVLVQDSTLNLFLDQADDCTSSTTGAAVQLTTTKLIIEHNSTDQDTGVHGAFDGLSWSELCVFDPNGRQVLGVRPLGQLKDLTMSGIFFESREPPNNEFSIADLMAQFPEGLYSIRGTTLDGKRMKGAATFTHDIPAAPTNIFPYDGAVVDSSGLVKVTWDRVTQTLTGRSLKTTGYEVIITKLVADDPNGFSQPTLDVHLPPSQTMLTVPGEFLEPGTRYELEVLALEVSGNQTITVSFFETQR